MATTTVSARGQLVIPYKLREKYNVKPNTQVEWIDMGKGLMVIPISEDPIKSSRGMLKGTRISTESLLSARQEDKDLEEKRFHGKRK